MDISSSTLFPAEMEAEIDSHGAVLTHTYCGRDGQAQWEETTANVVHAFAVAQRACGEVWLVTDGEDTGFAGADSEFERLISQPIEDERHALLAWWDSYGFASGPEAVPLQRRVAALAGVDYRMLTPAQ